MKQRHNKIIYLLIFFLAFSSTKSQDTLSLEEAVVFTFENNYGIRIAKNNAEINENKATIGNAGLLPNVSGTAGATYNNNNTYVEFLDNRPPTDVKGAISTNLNASVGLNYTLFGGLGNIYNFKLLKETAELSDLQARLTIENTLVQVIATYNEVAALQENLKILNEVTKISYDRWFRANEIRNYGAGTGIELLSAKVDLDADSINLLTAEQNLENAKRNLNLILGREIDKPFEATNARVINDSLSLNPLRDLTLNQNIQLLINRSNQDIYNYTIKISQASRVPKLSLTSSYGYNNSQAEVSVFTLNQTTGFTGGLSLSVPLFSGFQKDIAVQNAKIQLENSEIQQEETIKRVETDLLNMYSSYKNNLRIIQNEKLNVQTARLNFERSEQLFSSGQITNTQFREAQTNLWRAESNLNNAFYQAKLAETELLRLSGQLLSEN